MTAWTTFHLSFRTRIELVSIASVGARQAAQKVSFFGDEVEELDFWAKPDEALRLVRGLLIDPGHSRQLRTFAEREVGLGVRHDPSRCDDGRLAELLAGALASGQVKAYRVTQRPHTPPALVDPPPPGPSYAPPAKYFELQVVFEHDGSGVARLGLQVTGSDDAPSKATTNSQGLIRLNGLEPGSYAVASAWNGAKLEASVVECGWGSPLKVVSSWCCCGISTLLCGS